MAFTGRTPESLIPRSDSRNPATTCKGITKSGRPCRRPIDAKASQDDGVLAVTSVISDDDDEEIGAAAYFCWQHKDQAEHLAAQGTGQDTHLYPLKERTSIDTLVERLGVLEVEETTQPRRKRRESRSENKPSGPKPPRRINRPPTWDNVEGPLISIPSDVMAAENRRRSRPPRPPPQRKKPSFWASLCCASTEEDDVVEVIRHKKRVNHAAPPEQYVSEPMQKISPVPIAAQGLQSNRRRSTSQSRPLYQNQQPLSTTKRTPLSEKPIRPVNARQRQVSQTSYLLTFIPPTLTPQLTSLLLAELSKPISPHDEEGYIYIFWLTPDAAGPAPDASGLLNVKKGGNSERRTSDVLRKYSVRRPAGVNLNSSARDRVSQGNEKEGEKDKDKILLKIGRANNVHRRMNEWTRQCGYSLSLIRYYPYVPSSASPSPQPSPSGKPGAQRQVSGQGVRKVPHAHRVERLIHLELSAQRVVKKCEACGKEHREWFEVEASRKGVKGVDGVVRRWVEWAERRDEEGR